MPIPKDLSRETRIYLAIWRKALTSPKPVEINLPDAATALTVRMAMYRAIRPFREGTQFDEDLRTAAGKFVLTTVKPDKDVPGPAKLILKERITLTEMEKQLHDLGISEEDLLLTEEKLVEDVLHGIAIIDEAHPTEPRKSTPFYTRED